MGFFDIFRRKKKEKDIPFSSMEEKKEELIANEQTVDEPKNEQQKPKRQTKPAEKKAAPKPQPEEEKKPEVKAENKKTVEPVTDEIEVLDGVNDAEEGALVEESKPSRTGKFDIKRAKDGRFFFNLYASNHVVVARSQVYSSSTAAMNGIKSVIANAPRAQIEDQTLKKPVTVPFPKWEVYIDNAGDFRFRLCAPNGSCICHSKPYSTKSNCKRGIESIIRFATDATINKVYLDSKTK